MTILPPALRGSVLVGLACLAAAAAYGWSASHSVADTLDTLWIVLVLAVLEISLSFDNAVVNASILGDLDPVWQKRFLTWGVAISVVGTRVLFPLAVVGFAAGLGPVDAVRLSLTEPARYEAILRVAHVSIAGFGGCFLLMVGLGFFLDIDKEEHWLGWAEKPLRLVGGLRFAEIVVPLLVVALVGADLPFASAVRFLAASLLGLLAYTLMEALGNWLEDRQHRPALARSAAQAGLAGFLYLNVLDASFSLDGVIGAFALSNNMVIIALGLTIGAVAVRAMTMALVRHAALDRLRYLEHGAFWAITALGITMLISTRVAIPEALTGLIGAGFIAAAIASSLLRHPAGDR